MHKVTGLHASILLIISACFFAFFPRIAKTDEAALKQVYDGCWRLRNHIERLVGRYKGKIYQWGVVNEAVTDDSVGYLRESMWLKICGEDFSAQAFEFAHAADPYADLFYNDYNTERADKRDRVYKLLKKLKDANIPVHGVGLQGHWSLHSPSAKELTAAIKRFSELGLKVQITEMDISIYPWQPKPISNSITFSKELADKQAIRYE